MPGCIWKCNFQAQKSPCFKRIGIKVLSRNQPSRICRQICKQVVQLSAKVDGCLGCHVVHISCFQSHSEIGICEHCLSALYVVQPSFHFCIKHADVGLKVPTPFFPTCRCSRESLGQRKTNLPCKVKLPRFKGHCSTTVPWALLSSAYHAKVAGPDTTEQTRWLAALKSHTPLLIPQYRA